MPAVLPAQNGQSNGGLEEARRPLLPTQTADSGGGGSDSDAEGGELPTTSGCGGGGCSTAGGVANLVTTAVGAGMVALPRAVSGAPNEIKSAGAACSWPPAAWPAQSRQPACCHLELSGE